MGPANEKCDVFISYNSANLAHAEALETALVGLELRIARDRSYLKPGLPWQPALEAAIRGCRLTAVLVGAQGPGRWQAREVQMALDRQVQEPSYPVVPVLLPGAELGLSFLAQNTWLDLDCLALAKVAESLASALRVDGWAEDIKALSHERRAAVSPYRGLAAFKEEDERFFFGRDTFKDELFSLVAQKRRNVIAVVGPSGSGKSSIVRAGLIPRLRCSLAPDESDERVTWEIVTMTPRDDPLSSLAAALVPLFDPDEFNRLDALGRARKCREYRDAWRKPDSPVPLRDLVRGVCEQQAGTDRLFLLIDQWEELYTFRDDDPEIQMQHRLDGQRLIAELLDATERAPLTVVLTVRADFWHQVLAHRPLVDKIREATLQLPSMNEGELGQVIGKPAERVGLRLEPGLETRLVNKVGEEPGNLPLLEFCLQRLWTQRRDGVMTHAAYDAFGGLSGAIAARAEDVLHSLDEERRKAARPALLSLVNPGDGIPDTRRRASLVSMTEPERRAMAAFTDARLVVTGYDKTRGEESIEVAHETLLRSWGTLRKWIDERRDDLRLVREVQDRAQQWLADGRDKKYRLPHERVRDAAEALARIGADVHLGEQERAFLGPTEPAEIIETIRRPETEHRDRAFLGERLSVLGDPRPGVGCADGTPSFDWCPVTGGPQAVEVKPRRGLLGPKLRTQQVPAFEISRYPVTAAQYRAFVDAEDGWGDERWWGKDLFREAAGNDYDFGPFDTHPAVYVSWFDAVAFCRWLTERCRSVGMIDPRQVIRLPDEWEWQRAAEGGDETPEYPWGNGWDSSQEPFRANTFEAKLGRATAVGMYPAGASTVGALDMAGTVHEWCANKHDHPDVDRSRPDDFDSRVLRGGSWDSLQDDARSAYRSRLSPGDRGNFIGFRVLCSSPIVDH